MNCEHKNAPVIDYIRQTLPNGESVARRGIGIIQCPCGYHGPNRALKDLIAKATGFPVA